MPKKRYIILIDGSNFYFKLRDLKLDNLLDFDFSSFGRMLAGDDTLTSMAYYVGKVRTVGTKKSKQLQANQQKLLAHLRKHSVKYTLGYLMKSDGRYHEKGVDVAIAVDILVAAYENQADRIILVSSDTDLLPAVIKAKEKGTIVEYVGFSHKPSVALVAKCSLSRLLPKADLIKFLKK